MCFGSRGPRNFSPKCIDWEGLGRRRTGTRQGLGSVHTNPDIFETAYFFTRIGHQSIRNQWNPDINTALFWHRSAESVKTTSTRWIRIKSKRFQTDFQIRVNMALDGKCGITITSLVMPREWQFQVAGWKVVKLLYFLTLLYAKSSLVLSSGSSCSQGWQRYQTRKSISSGYILGKPIGLSTR